MTKEGINGEQREWHQEIRAWIEEYMDMYQKKPGISSWWGRPLVGFADAFHPYIQKLKQLISSGHQLPCEIIPDARSVIVYFVPFTKELADTNMALKEAGQEEGIPALASSQWALAYEQTNAMFEGINGYIIQRLKDIGFQGAVSPEAGTFDQNALISNWSQRHFAYAAGLGTFGINHMLISEAGCCGRYSSVVTNLPLKADEPVTEERCLYKRNGSCGVCVSHCVSGALTVNGYDRKVCYGVLKRNAAVYTEFGSSYTDASGENPNSEGSEVCGKCVVGLPCSFKVP